MRVAWCDGILYLFGPRIVWDANDSAERGAGGSRTRCHSRWSGNDHAEQPRRQGSAISKSLRRGCSQNWQAQNTSFTTQSKCWDTTVAQRTPSIRSICRSLVRSWTLWRRWKSNSVRKDSMCAWWQVSVTSQGWTQFERLWESHRTHLLAAVKRRSLWTWSSSSCSCRASSGPEKTLATTLKTHSTWNGRDCKSKWLELLSLRGLSARFSMFLRLTRWAIGLSRSRASFTAWNAQPRIYLSYATKFITATLPLPWWCQSVP